MYNRNTGFTLYAQTSCLPDHLNKWISVVWSTAQSPFSFLLGDLLFLPQFRIQLPDVVMEVFLDLFEKAEHEEHFVVYEEWSEDERSE